MAVLDPVAWEGTHAAMPDCLGASRNPIEQ